MARASEKLTFEEAVADAHGEYHLPVGTGSTVTVGRRGTMPLITLRLTRSTVFLTADEAEALAANLIARAKEARR